MPLQARQHAASLSADDLSEPEIIRVDLQVADLHGQVAFYSRILGLTRVGPQKAGPVPLMRHPDGPELVLHPGGHRHATEPAWQDRPALRQKVFLGFMTREIDRAGSGLRAAHVRILRESGHHEWGGDGPDRGGRRRERHPGLYPRHRSCLRECGRAATITGEVNPVGGGSQGSPPGPIPLLAPP
ncbi:MAG TPA: hypothetical protein DCM86_05645 [Verrucomicrobiales bacterium]|nr:hypothetical protein [Verrucomicrobiales bacterium]